MLICAGPSTGSCGTPLDNLAPLRQFIIYSYSLFYLLIKSLCMHMRFLYSQLFGFFKKIFGEGIYWSLFRSLHKLHLLNLPDPHICQPFQRTPDVSVSLNCILQEPCWLSSSRLYLSRYLLIHSFFILIPINLPVRLQAYSSLESPGIFHKGWWHICHTPVLRYQGRLSQGDSERLAHYF